MAKTNTNAELKRISEALSELWDDLEDVLQENYEPEELEDESMQRELELEVAGFCSPIENAMDLIEEAMDELEELIPDEQLK